MFPVQRSKENVMKKAIGNTLGSTVDSATKSESRRSHVRSKAMQTVMDFDRLPDSANVRMPVVEVLLDCSTSTVWRKVKKRVLPQPRRLGSNVAHFNVGELRVAMRSFSNEA